MKVILLKDIAKLGARYDIKEVSSGYAINMLIPKGDAIAATAEAMKKVQAQKAKLDGERKVQEDLIAKNLGDLDGASIKIVGKANAKGSLFAGLHKEAIADEVRKQTKLQLDPSFIDLEHPIKEVGQHIINVKAGGESAKINLSVEAE